MKQELTLAVALLAIGGLLWVSGSASNSLNEQAQTRLGRASTTTNNLNPNGTAKPIARSDWHVEPVVQASFQQLTVPDSQLPSEAKLTPEGGDTESNLNSPAVNSLQPSCNGQYLHASSDAVSVELLAGVAKMIANSKPFGMKLNLNANVFQQNVVAQGDYYQMGQGSHKTKIELSFDQMPGKPTMQQLCDGRFIYTIHSTRGSGDTSGDKIPASKTLEFVDLVRVKEAAGDATSGVDSFSPTGWVATGGIASLLQHLASGFNFGPPEPLDPNSNQILIRGSWDEGALRGIISELSNKIELGTPIQWDQVPQHIPHAIELVLGRSQNQTYFPAKLNFLRFDIADQRATIKRTVSMSFSRPQPLMNLSDGFFVVDSFNLEPTDVTNRYIARIESFRRTQQSDVEQVAIEQPASDTLTK